MRQWVRACGGGLVIGLSAGAHARGGPAAFGMAIMIMLGWMFFVLPIVVAAIAAVLAAPGHKRRVFWLTVPVWLVGAYLILRFGLFLFPLLPALGAFALGIWLSVLGLKRRQLAGAGAPAR